MLRDQDLPRNCRLLQPRGYIGGIAHRGVVHAQVIADAAHHHKTRVQALAHLKSQAARTLQLLVEGLERLYDGKGRVHRPPSMILVCDGGAKQRHDAVAQELVDRALVAMHLAQHQLQRPAHDRVHLLGVQALGQRGGAHHVHEEHRDQLALALEGAL